MRLHARHLFVRDKTLYRSFQRRLAVHIQIAQRPGELSRNKRHERLDLPFAFGSETEIHAYRVLYIRTSAQYQRKLIDR